MREQLLSLLLRYSTKKSYTHSINTNSSFMVQPYAPIPEKRGNTSSIPRGGRLNPRTGIPQRPTQRRVQRPEFPKKELKVTPSFLTDPAQVDGSIGIPGLDPEEAATHRIDHDVMAAVKARALSEKHSDDEVKAKIADMREGWEIDETDTDAVRAELMDQDEIVTEKISIDVDDEPVNNYNEVETMISSPIPNKEVHVAEKVVETHTETEIADRTDTVKAEIQRLVTIITKRNKLIRNWNNLHNAANRDSDSLAALKKEIVRLKNNMDDAYASVYSYLEHPDRIDDGYERSEEYITTMRQYVDDLKSYYEPIPGELAEAIANVVQESDQNTPTYRPVVSNPNFVEQEGYSDVDNSADYYRARLHDLSVERTQIVTALSEMKKTASPFRRFVRFLQLDSQYKELVADKKRIEAQMTEMRQTLEKVKAREEQGYRIEVPE